MSLIISLLSYENKKRQATRTTAKPTKTMTTYSRALRFIPYEVALAELECQTFAIHIHARTP